MQTAANQNDLIIKEIRIAKEEMENVKLEVENVKLEVENVKVEVENVKVEVENVKVEMKDFKNQVSADMSKLVKALEKIEVLIEMTPDPYSCIGCSMGSFCLDGKPVGCPPLEKAMVRANRNITTDSGDIVYAGDTGIGYYQDTITYPYAVIWKKAGVQQHIDTLQYIVYKCGANRQ